MPAFPFPRDPHAVLARLGGADTLVRATEVAIVVLLAFQTARLAWLLLPPVALGTTPSVDAGAAASRPDRLVIDAFHPGSGTMAATADASGLRLFALRTDRAGGSAIIAGEGGPQRSHAVGDEVAPGVVLAEVHTDHAVLNAGGRRSRLSFPAQGNPGTRSVAAPPQGADLPPPLLPSGTATAPIDPARLLAQTGLTPVESGGRVSGYTVVPRGDGAVLRQAGLQAGDVLLSVNGQELTPERYAELGDSLAGAATITLTYRRDGQVRTATLQATTP